MAAFRLTLLKAAKNSPPRLDPAALPLKKIRTQPESASTEWVAGAEKLLIGNTKEAFAKLKKKLGGKGKIDKYQVVKFGDFTLLHNHNELLLQEKDQLLWQIDCSRFGGSPELKVTHHSEPIDIELGDAYYPGTLIPASLKARISQDNGVWQIRLRLKFGGFDTTVPLASWLNQTTQAVSVVHADFEACPLGTTSELHIKGIGLATFSPSWLLAVAGLDICQFPGLGTNANADVAAIALLDSNGPQYILPKTWRRTGILFASDSEFAIAPEFNSTTPHIHLGDFRFNGLAMEAGLDNADTPLRILFAQSVGDPVAMGLQTGGDLYGSDGEPFRVPLYNPIYIQVFDASRNRVASGLLAQVGDEEFWMHSPAISLLFSRYKLGIFGMLDLGNNATQVFCRLQLRKTAPRVEDMLIRPEPIGHTIAYITWQPLPQPIAPQYAHVEVDANANTATILLPGNTALSMVRRDDFLALGYKWYNLRLETKGTQRRLLPVEAGDSHLAVVFPPQSIGEEVFFEENPNYPMADSDMPASQQQKTGADVSNLPPPPVKALLAKQSRLVFKIDAGTFEVSKNTLLDWNGLTPSLAATAQPRLLVKEIPKQPLATETPLPLLATLANKKTQQRKTSAKYMFAAAEKPVIGNIHEDWKKVPPGFLMPKPEQPAATTTQIEIPFRLILSPNKHGAWVHNKDAVAHDGRHELWHTRLATRSGKNIVEGPHFYRTVRAIWSRDHDITPDANTYKKPFLMPMDQNDRWQLVHLTADFSEPKKIGTPEPVTINNMMLTALGGWLDSNVKYEPIPGSKIAIENWRHRATMGRDHYVRIIYKGFLYPFGHRASLIKISERKVQPTPDGDPAAYIRQRMFIVVREPERSFDGTGYIHAAREMPLKHVRLTTLITPDLDHPSGSQIPGYGVPTPLVAFWPRVAGYDFQFHVKAWDDENHEIDFLLPLAFFRSDVLGSAAELEKAVDAYNAAAYAALRQTPLDGQQVAYAEASGYEGKTTFDTSMLRFEARKPNNTNLEPPCYPYLKSADVAITAIRQLTDSEQPATIEIDPVYLEHAFDASKNKAGLFAKIPAGAPSLNYNSGNSAERSGGVITPSISIKGLSRELGTVSYTSDSERDKLAEGRFNPLSFFAALDANLLGGISLRDILDTVLPGDFLSNAPKTVTQNSATEFVTTLSWKTQKLVTHNPFISSYDGSGAELTLASIIETNKQSGNTTFELKGQLDNFEIDLAGVIIVSFKQFRFNSVNGQKPDVHVDIADIKFQGALEFVNKIQDYLSPGNFIDPPYLDVTPSGITAGYNLTIPSIGVGVFSLQNLALGARMTLPFTGEPMRLRFNISERQSPFIVTVGIFGGGGFFAIAVGMDGLETLEASLEFGGNVSINLGVASGGVYIMAGVYFRIDVSKDEAELTGYLRAGGSLSVIGLITVSMEFYLGLKYDFTSHKAWGEASVTIEVEVLLFSVSVTATMRRQFAGSAGDPPFGILMPKDRWSEYAEAFA